MNVRAIRFDRSVRVPISCRHTFRRLACVLLRIDSVRVPAAVDGGRDDEDAIEKRPKNQRIEGVDVMSMRKRRQRITNPIVSYFSSLTPRTRRKNITLFGFFAHRVFGTLSSPAPALSRSQCSFYPFKTRISSGLPARSGAGRPPGRRRRDENGRCSAVVFRGGFERGWSRWY